jgi:hypothetical protein
MLCEKDVDGGVSVLMDGFGTGLVAGIRHELQDLPRQRAFVENPALRQPIQEDLADLIQ